MHALQERGAAVVSPVRLLLIDDEERILRSLAQAFRPDYEVWTTGNPDQALKWVQQQHFHVVLCDQRMPSLPGVELLRRMRQLSPATVRLLLTGYADIPAIIASINEGEIWRFVSKPWDPQILAETVAQAVANSAAGGQQPAIQARSRSEPMPLLVFDEDPQTAATITDQAGAEVRVTATTTLEQALQFVATEPVPVLVSEILQGGVETTPLLHAIRQTCPDLILLVVTGHLDSRVLIQLVNQCQVFRFLTKPIVPQRLKEALDAARSQRYRLLAGRPLCRTGADMPDRATTTRGFPARIAALFRKLRDEHPGPTA
jgi:DNA-binding NtrC family response regulator